MTTTPTEPSQPVEAKPSAKEQEYLEGWRRARAELDNFRKRIAQEQMQAGQRLTGQIVESLLPLADNFSAIAAHVPAHLAEDPWAKGVVHVGRQLETILQEFGVEAFGKAGEMFDARLHEVVGEETGDKPNQVISVTRPGYKIGDTVIRPAQVRVSS